MAFQAETAMSLPAEKAGEFGDSDISKEVRRSRQTNNLRKFCVRGSVASKRKGVEEVERVKEG